jgi:hypothetical protein
MDSGTDSGTNIGEHEQEGADEATVREKIDGLVEQVRADFERGEIDDPAAELRARLAESGLPISGTEFERIVADLRKP